MGYKKNINLKIQGIVVWVIIYLMCFILNYSSICNAQDTIFLNKILDCNSTSLNLVINIKSTDFEGKAVISKSRLFGYLYYWNLPKVSQPNKNHIAGRTDFIKSLIFYNDTLYSDTILFTPNDQGSRRFSFFKVVSFKDIEEIFLKGKKYFLNYYFIMNGTTGRFNYKVLDCLTIEDKIDYVYSIIEILNRLEIYSFFEEYSGDLIIDTDDPGNIVRCKNENNKN